MGLHSQALETKGQVLSALGCHSESIGLPRGQGLRSFLYSEKSKAQRVILSQGCSKEVKGLNLDPHVPFCKCDFHQSKEFIPMTEL